jgi:CYTH domain-containing protein
MPENENNLEIERKFLVKNIPESLHPEKVENIRQGYLIVAEDHSELRVRQKGESYYLTLKKPAEKFRTEIEIEISREQFDTFWPHTKGKRVKKSRSTYKVDGNYLEVDTYEGSNEGLMTVDIEFKSIPESSEFAPPEWFDKEITDEEKYKNQNLAR